MKIKTVITETLPLQGFRIDSVMRHSFGIMIQIVADRWFLPRCGQRGRPGKYRDTRPERKFRRVPLWGIPVVLLYAPRRVFCRHCGGIFVESIPWAAGKRPLTEAFACYLATWARLLP